MNTFSTVQTASNAHSRWSATNTQILPLPRRANPTSYRVPTSPLLYRLGVWEVPGIRKVRIYAVVKCGVGRLKGGIFMAQVPTPSHEPLRGLTQSASSGPAYHPSARAHPKPPRTPPRHQSQADARAHRTS